MKYRIYILFLLTAALLGGCKTGAESISELNGMLYEAVKSGSEKKMLKCVPSKKDMEMAYNLYYTDQYPDPKEREKAALEKAVSMRLSLTLAFRNVLKEAKEKGIDWKKAKFLDLKYSVKDRTAGYKEAKVRMIIESATGKNVIVFDALESEKRWFLVEKMAWEE
jgi:hypothetical protein